MAAWKPVFAYKWWWLTETVLPWITWNFFDIKDWNDFIEKFNNFHKNNLEWKYESINCQKQASLFSSEIFEKKIKKIIKQ